MVGDVQRLERYQVMLLELRFMGSKMIDWQE